VEERQASVGGFLSAVGAPPPSGYRRHPIRSWLVRVERGNRARVRMWIRIRIRSADREEGPIPCGAKDDPRSECRRPKGSRKPGQMLVGPPPIGVG
jgi:hypothetical protein